MAPFRADFANRAKAFVRGTFSASADRSLVERVATDMSSAPERIALGALEATWNHGRNVPTILSQLKLPLMAINAEGSSTDMDSMRCHGVGVVLMPGVGHFPMLERPLEFNTCLVQVVEALTSGRGSDA
jgi:pimeloyl-ACP methyl ester carboxylesterase